MKLKHLTLGELISELEGLDARPEENVRFDDGRMPAALSSYRGYYEQLAIEPYREDWPTRQPLCFSALLMRLRDCIGSTVEGYKGGSYRIYEGTPTWLSEWGEAEGLRIVAVGRDDRGIEILTCEAH